MNIQQLSDDSLGKRIVNKLIVSGSVHALEGPPFRAETKTLLESEVLYHEIALPPTALLICNGEWLSEQYDRIEEREWRSWVDRANSEPNDESWDALVDTYEDQILRQDVWPIIVAEVLALLNADYPRIIEDESCE